MKSWRAQLAGAVMLAVMAVALGVEAGNLRHRTAAPPPVTATSSPIAIIHHACAQADATGDNTGIIQSADGRLSACLRVGSLAAGTYQIVARRNASGVMGGASTTPSGDWIKLTPSSGPPGTPVKASGYVVGTTAAQRGLDHARLCWAGCDALSGSVAINWSASQPGHFTADFTAPAAPWYGPSGVVPLRPGRYSVTFPCMPDSFDKPSGVCNFVRLAANFDLSPPASGQCMAGSTCASLQATPADGPPGTVVAVDGWAPLTGLDGNGFVAVATEGQPSGKPGFESFTPLVATTPFTVTGTPGWAGLPPLHPVSIQRTGMDPIGVDPNNPSRFAYCADGVIEITSNAGRNWSAISLAGVKAASAATNYPIPSPFAGPTKPACDAVSLDAKNPGTIYAVFSTVPRNSGPPPFNFVGYLSRNFGRTWQPVPVPSFSEMGLFGGFRADRSSVQALFWKSETAMFSPDQNSFIVQETMDGGRTWHAGSLRCPASGPCINLGPQDNGRCQAVGEWQAVEISADQGRSWSSASWPNRLTACSTSELVGLARGGVAALDGSGQYPLTLSTDGAMHSGAIALPRLPGGAGDLGNFGWTLQTLPDGRLLVTGPAWYLLGIGASQWCAVSGAPANQNVASPPTPIPIGDHLWWTDSSQNGPGDFTTWARSLPISGVHC
jgi:hypothetical protein